MWVNQNQQHARCFHCVCRLRESGRRRPSFGLVVGARGAGGCFWFSPGLLSTGVRSLHPAPALSHLLSPRLPTVTLMESEREREGASSPGETAASPHHAALTATEAMPGMYAVHHCECIHSGLIRLKHNLALSKGIVVLGVSVWVWEGGMIDMKSKTTFKSESRV